MTSTTDNQPDDTTAIRAAIRAAFFTLVGWVGGVFMVFGLVFILFYGVPELRRAKESWNWSTTTGRIIKSHIENDEGSHFPKVLYEYEVNDASYKSDTVFIGSGIGMPSRQRSQEIVKRYPVGKDVTVYYAPAYPQQAVLEPGVHGTTLFFIYFGGAIFGGGLLAFFVPRCIIAAHSRKVRKSHKPN